VGREADGTGVTSIVPGPPQAQTQAHQTFRRPSGRSTVREGVLLFNTAKRVPSPPCIDRSADYNQ